jgi:plasmid stability protein
MSSITIRLPEQQFDRLREIACRFGLSVEDLARISIEEMLAQPDEKFERAADHVLKKNDELYRRLA